MLSLRTVGLRLIGRRPPVGRPPVGDNSTVDSTVDSTVGDGLTPLVTPSDEFSKIKHCVKAGMPPELVGRLRRTSTDIC